MTPRGARTPAGETPADASWRLTDAALQARELGDEIVVYNTLSGDTHLLAIPQGEVLELLRPGPCTTADLIAHLRVRLNLDDSHEHGAQLEHMLRALCSLELIEPMEE